MATKTNVKTDELSGLERDLTRAQDRVKHHETELMAAQYGLKNARKLLFDAEDALSAYYARTGAEA